MVRIDAFASDEGLYRRRIEGYPNAREALGAFLDLAAQRRGGGVPLPSFIGWINREGYGVFDPVAPATELWSSVDALSTFGAYGR